MTTFRYKGQTAGGAKVSGVLRAYDEFEAADKLRESVAIITKLEAVPEKKESVLSRPVAFRVKEKELALLCSQFAIILASGLSVERCVSMVAAQTKNKYLRRMLDKVSEEVGAGYSLAQSFENNAPYLPKTFTETLRAGEQSGTLESCFQRLHAYYDRSAKTRAKIVSTLTYPVMVIMVGVGERSGALEETLDVIGGYYDNEVSVTTARLLAVLEPAITIALAVLVVLLLLAVYLPMFTLYGGI